MKNFICLFLSFCFFLPGFSQTGTVVRVKANQRIAEVNPAMWGLFYEDINFGADGGLYAELVKNRSFEFYRPLMGWKLERKNIPEGAFLILNREDENPVNPRFIRVTTDKTPRGQLGITNEGFRGMGVKKGLRYDFSVMYRQSKPGVKLSVELLGKDNKIIGTADLVPSQKGAEWKKQSVSFTSDATDAKAKLRIWFEGTGVIDLDMISLFPGDTWKKRPGGLRADIIQLFADMKPGFLRFPGGCIVEGFDLSERYQWKNTIGRIEERKVIINRWSTGIPDRLAPDYYQTGGLGFFEYFQLAEDIGAEPMPIINCGMACQYSSGEVASLEQLDPYVQDALDLVEFANGATDTKWGRVRAEMGHPSPFNMKMIGIGNENWGPQFNERLRVFEKAIRKKYPEIRLIVSDAYLPPGPELDGLRKELKEIKVDIIDEHYYRSPEWFFANANRYDNYERSGPKIFAGEYSAQTSHEMGSGQNKNNWLAALSEAAFMTGFERNAAVVTMTAYAPLLAHTEGWQGKPDLIWFDNLRAWGTPSYYVQKLFATNKGTHVVPALSNNAPLTGQDSLYASAVVDVNAKELIIKVVNASDDTRNMTFMLEGIGKKRVNASVTTLAGDLDQENSADSVMPLTMGTANVKGGKTNVLMKPHSLTIVRIPGLSVGG